MPKRCDEGDQNCFPCDKEKTNNNDFLKVKIGNKVYSAKDQPIMVILNDASKDLISRMSKENYKFCEYATDVYPVAEIEKWMKI